MNWGFAAALKEDGCTWDCAAFAGGGLLAGALLGGVAGYLIGGRRVIWLEAGTSAESRAP